MAEPPRPSAKSARGHRNFQAGLAAEAAVTRHYQARGYTLLDTRWRGKAGEIDLIFSVGPVTVFVEVKASVDFARAVSHIGPRQLARISAAAEEYMDGALGDMRVDAALVDETGRIEIFENITM